MFLGIIVIVSAPLSSPFVLSFVCFIVSLSSSLSSMSNRHLFGPITIRISSMLFWHGQALETSAGKPLSLIDIAFGGEGNNIGVVLGRSIR